jgi:hypothetical protein
LSIAFTLGWWMISRKEFSSPWRNGAWIASSWIAGLLAIVIVHWRVAGQIINPITFAHALHHNHLYFAHFASSIWDRNLLYIFIWLLPFSLPKLRTLPKTWLLPTAAATAVVFLLDAYYGSAPGTVGRELFTVAGPILSLSAASFLCTAWNAEPHVRPG